MESLFPKIIAKIYQIHEYSENVSFTLTRPDFCLQIF